MAWHLFGLLMFLVVAMVSCMNTDPCTHAGGNPELCRIQRLVATTEERIYSDLRKHYRRPWFTEEPIPPQRRVDIKRTLKERKDITEDQANSGTYDNTIETLARRAKKLGLRAKGLVRGPWFTEEPIPPQRRVDIKRTLKERKDITEDQANSGTYPENPIEALARRAKMLGLRAKGLVRRPVSTEAPIPPQRRV